MKRQGQIPTGCAYTTQQKLKRLLQFHEQLQAVYSMYSYEKKTCRQTSNIKPQQIPKLKCLSPRIVVALAQSIEARFYV